MLEVTNLWLFVQAILKEALIVGIIPMILLWHAYRFFLRVRQRPLKFRRARVIPFPVAVRTRRAVVR